MKVTLDVRQFGDCCCTEEEVEPPAAVELFMDELRELLRGETAIPKLL